MQKLLFIILIFTLPLVACGSKEFNLAEVEEIKLTIGGPKQQEYTVVLITEKENIAKVFKAEEKLKKYDPHNDIKTWKLDIKIEYILQDGSKVEKLYKGIRPVDEYLEDVYTSSEYQKQTLPLFKLDKGEKVKI